MRRTPSSTEAKEVARIGRTPMAAAAAATLTTSPETLLSTNAGEPTRPTITSFFTRYGLNEIFGSGNGESQLVINIQSTTSLAEKTVRPFLSSKAVVPSRPANKTSYFSSKMVVFRTISPLNRSLPLKRCPLNGRCLYSMNLILTFGFQRWF